MSPRTCSVEGCERPHNARGYCRTHYGHMVEGRVPCRPLTVSVEDRLEDLRFMAETGESLMGAAARLGITERGLDLWLARHDANALRADLRSRNPRDPNALANREAVYVDPAQARYKARKRAMA